MASDDLGFKPLNRTTGVRRQAEQPSVSQEDSDLGFKVIPRKDTLAQNLTRKAYQPIGGALELKSPLAVPNALTSLYQFLSTAGAMGDLEEEFSPQRIADLKEKFPFADFSQVESPEFRQRYAENVVNAGRGIPTIRNIESAIEDLTGLPLTPKSELDEALRTGGGGAALSPGNALQKLQNGLLAATLHRGATAAGVHPVAAAPLALGGASSIPKYTGSVQQYHPSGLPKRNFENLQHERKIAPSQRQNIEQSVEKDLRGTVKNTLLSKSAVARELESNPELLADITENFPELRTMVEKLPERHLNTGTIKNALKGKIKERGKPGLTLSEGDKSYNATMKNLLEELTPSEEEIARNVLIRGNVPGAPIPPTQRYISPLQIYDQYRRNNKELTQYFESGKSASFNTGKRDALLDYNRALSETFQKEYPNSPFVKLFKETNEKFSKLQDLSKIDSVMDDIFSGNKVNYKAARKALSDESFNRAINRVAGKEGAKEIKAIFRDFLTQDQVMSLIRRGPQTLPEDAQSLFIKYSLAPKLFAATKVPTVANYLRNSLLAKPEVRHVWSKSLEDLKKGRLEKAYSGFLRLEELEKQFMQEKKEEDVD